MIVVMSLTGTTLAHGRCGWPYASSMYGHCAVYYGTYYGGYGYSDRTAQRIDAIGGIVDTVVWATASAKQAEAAAAQANQTAEILREQHYQSSMQTQYNTQAQQQLQNENQQLRNEIERLQQEIRKLELELTKMKLQQEMQAQGKTK